MADEPKPPKSVLGTVMIVVSVISLCIGASGAAFGVSRASPADITGVKVELAALTVQAAVIKTRQDGFDAAFSQIRDELIQIRKNGTDLLKKVHQHPLQRATN